MLFLSELNDKLKKFAQFMSVSDYETLLENLRRQRQLYARVDKLHYYRSELGMTSLAEIDEYVRAKQERKLTKPKRFSYLLGLSKRVTRGGSRASSPNKSCDDFAMLPSKRPYVRKNSLVFGTPNASNGLANGHAKNGNGHAKRGRKPKNPPAAAPQAANLVNFDDDIYDDEEESNNDEVVEEEAEEEEESEDLESIENSEPEDDEEEEEEEEEDEEDEDNEDEEELEETNSTEQEEEEDVDTTTSSSGSAVYELNEDNVVCRLRRLTSRSSSINNSAILNISPKSSAVNASATRNGKASRLSPAKKNKAVVAAAAALIKKLKKPLKNNSQLVNSGRKNTIGLGRKRKRVKLSNSRNDGRAERVCSMPGYNLLSENEKKVNKKKQILKTAPIPTKTRNRIYDEC
jgi:hypothetical protein